MRKCRTKPYRRVVEGYKEVGNGKQLAFSQKKKMVSIGIVVAVVVAQQQARDNGIFDAINV